MLISEIKKWAKLNGYDTIKNHTDEGQTDYYWSKIEDISITGVSPSIRNLAKDIFNDITDNRWEEHQKEYQDQKTEIRTNSE